MSDSTVPTSTTPPDPPSSPVSRPGSGLERRFSLNRTKEQLIKLLLAACALLSIGTTVGIIYMLLDEAVYSISGGQAFFQQVSVWDFFTGTQWTPQFEDKQFGILPLLTGTLLVTLIAALIGLPIGLGSAIYLSEYATPQTRRFVKPVLEVLAGIPTVVYGYFALVFVTPWLLRPLFMDLLGFDVGVFNAASAGIVVGIMIIPMVSSLSEDALQAVPRSLREAGFALGSTRLDVSARVVVPAAFSGVVASFLLAISRAVGETMAVTIAAGQTPDLTFNAFRSVETMTAFIVNVSLGDTPAGSIEYKSLYAVALTLFCMTLVMNIIAQSILRRYREVYQ